MTNTFRKSIVAAIALLGLVAMNAADAQRSRGGSGGGGGVAVSGGGFRGHPGGGFRGHPGRGWSGGAWVSAGRPWGWGPGWRHGWGPAWGPGWGGWGWGVGWNPWAWSPGFWGWSVGVPVVVAAPASSAWILPPSAQAQTWIERPAEEVALAPAAAEQWWYWCASNQAYYPYVQNCAEGWQRVAPQVPAGVQR